MMVEAATLQRTTLKNSNTVLYNIIIHHRYVLRSVRVPVVNNVVPLHTHNDAYPSVSH